MGRLDKTNRRHAEKLTIRRAALSCALSNGIPFRRYRETTRVFSQFLAEPAGCLPFQFPSLPIRFKATETHSSFNFKSNKIREHGEQFLVKAKQF